MIIGYTNGYFDLFHIGHLNLLRRAKSLCDTLMVGVISDEECQKRKGKTPIIPLKDRYSIVSEIACVDRAYIVDLDDKIIEWKTYRFNKLFVGSDHQNTETWNDWEIKFKRLGVDIIYLPYTREVSSTKIKLRIIDEAAKI